MNKKQGEGPRVGEAVLAYDAQGTTQAYPAYATTRLSAKNQLTLPVTMVRDLGLTPGDELNIWLEKDHIIIEKRLLGKALLDSLQGSMKGGEWSTAEGVQAWLRNVRDEWDRDDVSA